MGQDHMAFGIGLLDEPPALCQDFDDAPPGDITNATMQNAIPASRTLTLIVRPPPFVSCQWYTDAPSVRRTGRGKQRRELARKISSLHLHDLQFEPARHG